MKKPLSPSTHGIMDYVMSGIEVAVVPFLGLNTKASRTYQALGAGYTLLNALTRTPVGVKKKIPLRTHKRGDIGTMAGLALLSFAPSIRKDKRALVFNLALLGITALQFALTDFDKGEE